MKTLLFSALVLFGSFAEAQVGTISNAKIYKDSILKFHYPNSVALNLPEYKFLYPTEKGNVYESPVDRMRCLVPDFPSTMPVAGGSWKIPPESMPNAGDSLRLPPPIHEKIPGVKIVPLNKYRKQ